MTASGFTPSRSQAKNAPLRPTPVCTSSRISSAPCSSASARACASISGGSGCTPPSPCTGSSRIAAVSAPTCSSPNFAPGTSGSNAARFAGWPVTESAPSVRPWNEPSSATISVLPVALRAHLIAASFASAPELQKKRLRTAEAVRQLRGELLHRLREVEVRDVPQLLELCVRRRERCRCLWPRPTTAIPAKRSR